MQVSNCSGRSTYGDVAIQIISPGQDYEKGSVFGIDGHDGMKFDVKAAAGVMAG